MKCYRKTDAEGKAYYIELDDGTPVGAPLVQVSHRPSMNHVFSDNWQTDPLNQLVCWRLKTAQESDLEKTETAQKFSDYRLALKALAQVTWNSVPALKLAFPTYAEYQKAIINQYKALI